MYIALVLFLFSVIFLFGFAQVKHNSHRINKLSIDFGDDESGFLTSEMVNKLLIQSEGNPLNQLNSTINLHLLEESVKKNEMVQEVDVFFHPTGHLYVKIQKRKPIARIKTATQSYYLDDKGLAMPLSPQYSERVPLVTGIYSKAMEQELYILAQKFRTDDFFNKQIVGINRLSNGDYLLDMRIGKYKIMFGTPDDIDHKMRNLKVFYKKMWNDEKLKSYHVLNVKYKNQVVCSY